MFKKTKPCQGSKRMRLKNICNRFKLKGKSARNWSLFSIVNSQQISYILVSFLLILVSTHGNVHFRTKYLESQMHLKKALINFKRKSSVDKFLLMGYKMCYSRGIDNFVFLINFSTSTFMTWSWASFIYYVRKLFQKTNISYPLICTRAGTY